MENKMDVVMRKLAMCSRKMQAQEVQSLLFPLEKSLGIKISGESLSFSHEKIPPVLLEHIQLALVTPTHAYVLCCNGVLYSLDRRIEKQEVSFPALAYPGVWTMLLMMCRSCLDRFLRLYR